MTRIAILKPDHFGDLILSLPAIKKITESNAVDLIVQPGNVPLVKQLIPTASILECDFVHLRKNNKFEGLSNNKDQFPELFKYDLVIGLREDSVLNEKWYKTYCRYYKFVQPDAGYLHESQRQMVAISNYFGKYDPNQLFTEMKYEICTKLIKRKSKAQKKNSRKVQTIGLSIGSGFHSNTWSPSNWIDLAVRLIKKEYQVRIFSGVQEKHIAEFISRTVTKHTNTEVIVHVGGNDIYSFLSDVMLCKLVVAADGGTAHLCSLAAPIISIFGGSPYQRFRPLGVGNLVVTKNYVCSPCTQFSSQVINGCLGKECMDTVAPGIVENVIHSFDANANISSIINDCYIYTW